MKIALNGKMPTVEDLAHLSNGVAHDQVEIVSLVLGEDWRYYEENIEWRHLEVRFSNDQVLLTAGYTGLWELLSFKKLTRYWQKDTIDSLLEWAIDNMDNAELFE